MLTRHIDRAVGSVEKPMSDEALERKFTDLCDGILPPARIRQVMDMCWSIDTQKDVGAIARAAAIS